MSEQRPLYPVRDATASAKAPRTVRFWAVPIVISLAVLAALAALYLGGNLKPTSNLRHFPIALVNEDAGPTGEKIVKGLVGSLDKDKFDIRVLSRQEARQQLDTARIYGAALIPPDFSEKLKVVARSAIGEGKLERPVVAISTNPRAGSLGASIAGQTLGRGLGAVSARAGKQLSQSVAQQTEGRPLPSAVSLALANPIDIRTVPHRPLPDGTGNGLSAFYYSFLLMLGGFIGSVVVSMLVDSMLGYIPAEFGPVYRFAERVNVSRFYTLLLKWALVVVLALLTSAVYAGIAAGLGMPLGHGWAIWLYGVFIIAAVGITSTSLIAALGWIGTLVSFVLFVIVGLPSAGAEVPPEATPALFGLLSKFEPMHQVFLGTRALLYFEGQAKAGLSQAVAATALGLSAGLVFGAIVTNVYDRRAYRRILAPAAASINTPTAAVREAASVDEFGTVDAPEPFLTRATGAARQGDAPERATGSAARPPGDKP
jgi:uncharacterized phage infection (PIP) family protein YhgE